MSSPCSTTLCLRDSTFVVQNATSQAASSTNSPSVGPSTILVVQRVPYLQCVQGRWQCSWEKPQAGVKTVFTENEFQLKYA